MTKTLTQHLQELNARTSAWVAKDPENRFAFLFVEDADHWAAMGVHTVEDFELYSVRSELWDLYKEVHGIRPRWMNVWQMSREEAEEALESVRREACEQQDRYEADQKAEREAATRDFSGVDLTQTLEIPEMAF